MQAARRMAACVEELQAANARLQTVCDAVEVRRAEAVALNTQLQVGHVPSCASTCTITMHDHVR